MMMEQTIIRYFPWTSNQYTLNSRGFPDQHILLICITTKLMQLLCTLGVQLSVISKTKGNYSSIIAFDLVVIYLVSSVCNIVMFFITNFIRFRLGSTDAPNKLEPTAVSNPVLSFDSIGQGSQLVDLGNKNEFITQYKDRIQFLEEREVLLSTKLEEMKANEAAVMNRFDEISSADAQTQKRLLELEALVRKDVV